jgi:hypothetical protein
MDEQNGSNCLVLVDKQKIKATILHIGKGKFRILNDERNGEFVGRIIDASDVIHCRF